MADPPPPPPPPTDVGAQPPGWGTPPSGWGAPPPAWGGQPPGWGAPPPGWGGQPPGWGAQQPGWNAGFMPSQVGSGRFRSMSVGEWLDATFTLYRRNFVLIASISAVVQIPYGLLTLILFEVSGIAGFVSSPFGSLNPQTATRAQEIAQLNSLLGVLAVSGGVLLLAALVVFPLGEAATTRTVSDRYLDRPSSLRTAYRAAWGRLRSLIAMILLLIVFYAGCALVLTLVFVLLALVGGPVVGAVIAFVGFGVLALLIAANFPFALAAPAVVLERVSGWRGLKRSWQLVRPRFWANFGRLLLLALIATIISGVLATILQLPGTALDPHNAFVFDQIASAVARVFVGPITYIGVTLLYYDARIRKEGFDIEMLASSL
jgi:Membrane domain of glycerophosphoryl diester phosphodiesterase